MHGQKLGFLHCLERATLAMWWNGYGCQDGGGLRPTEQGSSPARTNVSTLDPVEGISCFTYNPKCPERDTVISAEDIATC